MTKEEILDYNKRCAEFLKLKKYIHSEIELDWYNKVYPDLPEYKDAYSLPINFPMDYEHPTAVHFIYNNPNDLPIQRERVSIAKLKFHLDWNWIMEMIEAIETKFLKFILEWNYDDREEFAEYGKYKAYWFTLYPKDEICSWLTDLRHKSRKEAVVQAINQFLIWYEQNKQL